MRVYPGLQEFHIQAPDPSAYWEVSRNLYILRQKQIEVEMV